MSILPTYFEPHAPPLLGANPLLRLLVQDGHLSDEEAIAVETMSQQDSVRPAEVLFAKFGVSALTIAEAFSTLYQAARIDPCELPAQYELLQSYGATRAIQNGILPWRKIGDTTVILTDKPDQFDRYFDDISKKFRGPRMAIATRDQIERAVITLCADELVQAAETKTPALMSSRSWHAQKAMRIGLLFLITLAACLVSFPALTISSLCALAILILLLNTGGKVAAAIASLRAETPPDVGAVVPARLPKITLLVPLFRETEIADHLLARLRDIDYPSTLLEVFLITECDDAMTREALGKTTLPTWMRPLIVPVGSLKTKPRALNFALDFAQGSIIGIYDAEDAPARDQLRVVAAHFANRGPEVACLQGVLDYYNDATNWLTRCFTIEYATWFRVVLPGFARLGLVVPLGGTTLFFRRDALDTLGGWDAHNVTEDADLGVRLARIGYRTELISSVTEEEANGRFWPWVKQRSRWLKGYAITYAVHMRSPVRLWRDLGAKRFFGVQLLFLGTLAQFVLAPLLWSFWLIPFGFAHPLLTIISPAAFWVLAAVFFASELINFLISAIALRAAKKTWLIKWAITLQFYFPLAALAAYKGLIELAWKPFFWDKTMHGVLLPNAPKSPTQPPVHQV